MCFADNAVAKPSLNTKSCDNMSSYILAGPLKLKQNTVIGQQS